MRQGSNGRRPRGRPQRKQHGGGPPRHGNFDSSGPEGRIRGNAHQVYEKYVGLARDATSAGDRVAAETYYQHAEHYYRIVNARTDPKPEGEGQSGRRGGNGEVGVDGEAAPQASSEQPQSAALNGEQPPAPAAPEAAPQAPEEAPPQAEDRPAPQRRRRPRQAKPAEPKPDSQPEGPAAAQPGDDSEPVEA